MAITDRTKNLLINKTISTDYPNSRRGKIKSLRQA
jgi:hypothetical protein